VVRNWTRSHPPAVTTGIGVVEVTQPLDSFDFSTADRWELLVLLRGEPVARVAFPRPGAIDSAELARALILPHAEAPQGRPDAPPSAALSCSVVLCTHGRPAYLATALDALARLDPAPLEVIVVDNAPGADDCEAVVLAKGFRYVREDRKGLDNARNAGVRAARGDLIAFTDDDCVVPAAWLAPIAAGFADPTVAAVTAPAFPYALDTPARVRMERQASLARGLHRLTMDWTLMSPLHAGQAGVGANMTIRGALLRSVPEPFPPELDAGTETRSGGDTYLFARLLAAGHRILYEPRAFVFHQHRPDWAALDRAVRGYGVGASAALWKLLLEDGELEAPRAGLWLVRQYLRAQVRRATGRGDAIETRIAWSYLRGALGGPRALHRARATQRAIDPTMRPAPPFPPPTMRPSPPGSHRTAPPAAAPGRTSSAPEGVGTASRAAAPCEDRADPAISVVIPTVGRGPALARCLAALATQTLPAAAFEVVVVDDSPERDTQLSTAGPYDLRIHRTGGRGAAMARNEGAALARGELLLFLDDDLVPVPELLERHRKRHAGAAPEAVVIGYSPPRPPAPGLAALGAALWWEDQFRALADTAAALSFTEALSGNVSIRRATFHAGNAFEPAFGRLRREDWEWGYRLLAGGAVLHYEHGAVAAHEYELTAGRRIAACRLEGQGDALLVRHHPDAAPHLPLATRRPTTWRHPLRHVASTALGHPRTDPLTLAALAALERARLRGAWSSLYRRAQRAAYSHGLRAGGWRLAAPGSAPLPAAEAIPTRPLPTTAAPPTPTRPLPAPRMPGPPTSARPLPPAGSPRVRARITTFPGADRPDGWDRILQATAAADADLIAITLHAHTPAPGWLAEVEPAFQGPRVALAIGRGLPAGAPAEPLTLHERRAGRVPYAPLGGPADYLVLRPATLPALRRAVARAAPHGPMAVAFACAEEVLAAGDLVAHRNVRGLDAASGDRAAREREKLHAWGALLGEHALDQPPVRSAAWMVALAGGGIARAARRSNGHAPVTKIDTGWLLLRGYAAAIRRRHATGRR
jgi:glycosyltransferase involved in cell wall biosynthesis